SALPVVPIIDSPPGEEPAVVSALAEPERLALLMASARRTYTALGLNWADARSRTWHGRSSSPYVEAVRKVGGVVGRRGAFLATIPTNGAAPPARRRMGTA